MTAAFVVLAIAAVLSHILAWVTRRDARRDLQIERDAHQQRLTMVLEQRNPDLAALIGVIENQMQRIQAPEVAVQDHSIGVEPVSPQAISPEIDAAWWESKEQEYLQQFASLEDLNGAAGNA